MDLFSYGDKDGKGTEARLQHPLGVASISADKLFIADSYNHKIKLVTELASKTPVCSTCPVEGQGFILFHFIFLVHILSLTSMAEFSDCFFLNRLHTLISIFDLKN